MSFRTVYNHKGPGHFSNDKGEQIHTLDKAFQLLDREGPFCPQHCLPGWYVLR